MAISLLLEIACSLDPDRVAVQDGSAELTTGRLARLVAGGASVISASEARTLAFIGANGPAFPVALFAAAAAGVPVAPLNYRSSADQLAALLARLEAPLIVADAAYRDQLPGASPNVLTTAEWMNACAEADPAGPEAAADDNDPAVLMFTSGTTAAPKCVVLRHQNLLSYVLGTVDPGSAGPAEAALVSVPPYHIAGVGTVLTNIACGRRLIYLRDFSPRRWLETVRVNGITFAMVVPTMLSRIVAELGDDPADLPSLRVIAYGGSSLPQPVLAHALRVLPEVDFVNAYGLTETSSTIAILGPEDHRAAAGSSDPGVRARLTSAGRLISGVEGQIRDDQGTVLPAGEAGDLWVRGPQVSGEYRDTGTSLDADGWFATRDRGRFDEDGYLFLQGRTDDVIIRGGENIAPAEIEDVLLLHPLVSDVAVIGLPDEEWGQQLAAVVVTAPGRGADPGALREWARARLRSAKTPDKIFFLEELPRNDSGKVLRRVLVSELSQGTSAD